MGYFYTNNNKWGAPNATQNITMNNGKIVANWNNSYPGWNYAEIIAGTSRYCGTNSWPTRLPLQWKNVNSLTASINYKFTQKPTNWWNLSFDLYWLTQGPSSGCQYVTTQRPPINTMIWIHGLPSRAGKIVKDDLSDGYNIWTLCNTSKNYCPTDKPNCWYGCILKNRDKIPYEPIVNQSYTITIDIKKLMDVTELFASGGDWYFPGIELGCENSGSSGVTTGAIQIDGVSFELNGETISYGNITPPPTTKYKCSGYPDYICSEDVNGTFNSLAECQAACNTAKRLSDTIINDIKIFSV